MAGVQVERLPIKETSTKRGLERLENWARWACGGETAMILSHFYPPKAAVCGEYRRRSGDGDDESLDPIDPPVDESDAVRVEESIRRLPNHLRNAVRFYYTGRPHISGLHRTTLREWVEHAARVLG